MATQLQRMMRSLMQLAPLVLLLVLLAGCVSRTDDGTEVHIRYEYWVMLLPFAGGLALIVASLAVTPHLRSSVILFGLLCTVFLAPNTALTGAWISADGFIVRHAAWGMAESADIEFDDIASVRDITKKGRGSRGRITNQPNLRFQLFSGETVDVPITNDVMRQAKKEIFQRLAVKRQSGG